MDSSSSCCVFNVEEEVVVIRNGWTPKKEKKKKDGLTDLRRSFQTVDSVNSISVRSTEVKYIRRTFPPPLVDDIVCSHSFLSDEVIVRFVAGSKTNKVDEVFLSIAKISLADYVYEL